VVVHGMATNQAMAVLGAKAKSESIVGR